MDGQNYHAGCLAPNAARRGIVGLAGIDVPRAWLSMMVCQGEATAA